MHPNVNPFTPGAGQQPAALAGRDRELELVATAVQRLSLGRPANGMMAYGLRGTGKTVLLGRFTSIAAEHGWIAVQAEAARDARTPFLERLSGRLSLHLGRLVKPTMSDRVKNALGAFKGFTLKLGLGNLGVDIEIDPRHVRRYTGTLSIDLPDMLLAVADAAAESGGGLMVCVDEIQDLAPEELGALCLAAHEASQQTAPLLVCGAGLPSVPRLLAESKSYSERLFDYAQVGVLDPAQARRVLVEPVEALGESWTDDALDLLLGTAQGYPYFLQVFGKAAWEVAAASPIGIDDARVARALGFDVLDQGFFLVRWDRATKAEREYLRCMAVDGDGPSAVSDVADRRGQSTQSLGPIRARLIDKGIVYSPEHGSIAFTVPGMATFIRRVDEHGG